MADLVELLRKNPRATARLRAAVPVYEIVVLGPAHPGAMIDRFIFSSNGRLYEASNLAKWAPVFAGQRVFFRHDGSDQPGIRHRVYQSQGKVGHIAAAWWEPDTNEIRARLRVTNASWQRVLATRQRFDYGFSVDIDATTRTFERGNGTIDYVKIGRVYSVDMVEDPATGGRFIGARPMSQEAIAEWWRDFEINTTKELENGTD